MPIKIYYCEGNTKGIKFKTIVYPDGRVECIRIKPFVFRWLGMLKDKCPYCKIETSIKVNDETLELLNQIKPSFKCSNCNKPLKINVKAKRLEKCNFVFR